MISLLALASTLVTLATPTAHAEGHFYAGARFGAAYPEGYVRTAYSPAIALGGKWDSGIELGLRFVALPNPPEVLGSNTPDFAVGPLLDFAYDFRVGKHLELYPTVSAGFAIGKGDEDGTNQILPEFQTGFGAHYLVALNKSLDDAGSVGNKAYFGPEIGVVPAVLAPYMAFSAGVTF